MRFDYRKSIDFLLENGRNVIQYRCGTGDYLAVTKKLVQIIDKAVKMSDNINIPYFECVVVTKNTERSPMNIPYMFFSVQENGSVQCADRRFTEE